MRLGYTLWFSEHVALLTWTGSTEDSVSHFSLDEWQKYLMKQSRIYRSLYIENEIMLTSGQLSAAIVDFPIVKDYLDHIFDDQWPRETVVDVLKTSVTKAIDDIKGKRASTDAGKRS